MLYACNNTSEWRFKVDGVAMPDLTLDAVFSEKVTYYYGGHAEAELCMELIDDSVFELLNWGVRATIIRVRKVVLEDGSSCELYENFGSVRVKTIRDIPGKNHIRKIVLEMERLPAYQ